MSPQHPTKRAGFTLIELMIVIAVIGIIMLVAVPKYLDLVRKANEGTTAGNLGIIRSGISIYYGDMERQYPSNFTSLTVNGKYLSSVPPAFLPPYHTSA